MRPVCPTHSSATDVAIHSGQQARQRSGSFYWGHGLKAVWGRRRGAAAHFIFFLLLAASLPLVNGCAVHYYDPKSGTEHLWGFGHMQLKVAPPAEGVQAVVKGTESLGLDIGAGQDDYRIALGWHRRRQIVVGSNAAVRFEWPNGDFFNTRVGALPPWATNSSIDHFPNQKIKK